MFKQRFLFIGILSLLFLCLMGCGPTAPDIEYEYIQSTDTYENIEEQTLSKHDEWYFHKIPLGFSNQDVKINFEVEMYVENNSGNDVTFLWQVNINGYPIVTSETFSEGITNWKVVSGNTTIKTAANSDLYLSSSNIPDNVKIKIRNLKAQFTGEIAVEKGQKYWLDEEVPSLKDTYSKYFDKFGLACEYSSWFYGDELKSAEVQKGLKYHTNTITMGNEFKPESIMNWNWDKSFRNNLIDFTDSLGTKIKVPSNNSLNFNTVDATLEICKKLGIKMRGHVLVWHSQTPDDFFAEGYSARTSGELITNLVDKDTMTARQEWYIKTVLEHVADWEAENNNGEHIIWAWDVVNEAMADDAGKPDNYLRGSTSKTKDKSPKNGGSRWYQIYNSDEYIINAFRFANAYAPTDIKLCYNDYNEYMDYSGGWKTSAILNTIKKIRNGDAQTVNGKLQKPRIDAIGMQSHVRADWPGVNSYETALKRYLDAGFDVHVTEFDVESLNRQEIKKAYKDYFSMFKKYGSGRKNCITCITIWGINNENSWIKEKSNAPLLFSKSGRKYYTTPAFWTFIDAAN